MAPRSHLTLVLLLAATAAGCGAHFVERDIADDRELPAGLRALAVEVPLGSITVEAGVPGRLSFVGRGRRMASSEAGLARLESLAVDFDLEETGDAGSFRYAVSPLPPELDPTEYAIVVRGVLRLPPDVAVDVRTGRGHLAVDTRRAAVSLDTGSGDVQVRGVAGPTRVETANGEVMIVGHRGSLDVDTGNGTVLGWIDHLDPGGVRIETTGPSLTLYLPRDAAFELDALARKNGKGAGSVRNGFGVAGRAEGAGGSAVGSVGGGGPIVSLRVGRGYLSVSPHDPTTGDEPARKRD